MGVTLKLPTNAVSPAGIAGAMGGIASTSACYPLEVLKVHPGKPSTMKEPLLDSPGVHRPWALW